MLDNLGILANFRHFRHFPGLSGLCINYIDGQRGIFPNARFGQNVLSTDRQPVHVEVNFAQLAVFRRPGMVGSSISRLENTDNIFFLVVDNIVFIKRPRCKASAFDDLFYISGWKFH